MSEFWNAEWVERETRQVPSELGRQVAEMMGILAGGGIYNAPIRHDKVQWSDPEYIEAVWYGELATWDAAQLTRLVLLAHDRCIRVSISGAAPKYLRLGFSPRSGRSGNIMARHPTIEQALADWRNLHPALEVAG